MRPEIMVMDAALTMLQPMLDSWATLSKYEGGKNVFVNNFLYAILGLQRIDAADFPSAYHSLLSKYAPIIGPNSLNARDFDPQQLLIVIWDVCKDIYGYDVLQAVRTGNAPYLQQALDQAIARDFYAQMAQRASGNLPVNSIPLARDADIAALLARLDAAHPARPVINPQYPKKKHRRH